jgi:hypothetical protein
MAGVYMDPETIAKDNEEKMAQNAATTPGTQSTELSGQAAPVADNAPKPGVQAQVPTKVTANIQGGSGGFQQANQVKIQALGNVAQQRIGERLSAANQAIQGQKAARVEDVNAQKYAGPQNASLESLGTDAKIGEVMSGAGRQADISKAAGQVAGFGAYNELRNLASGGMNRGYTQNLGLNGGGVDATLARANAQANQGVANQVRAANNQVKTESANLLKPIEEAGRDVSKYNTTAEQNINKNLMGQATAAEQEGQQRLISDANLRETQAVSGRNAQLQQQRDQQQAENTRRQMSVQDPNVIGQKVGVSGQEIMNLKEEMARGDLRTRMDALRAQAAYTGGDVRRIAGADQVRRTLESLTNQVNAIREAEGVARSLGQQNTALGKNDKITSYEQALSKGTYSPEEYAQIQQGQQALRDARSMTSNKSTALSSLSNEKQAGYEALRRILKDPSGLSNIDRGANSYSNFQQLLNKVK